MAATADAAHASLSEEVNNQLQLRWSNIESADISAGVGSDLLIKISIDGINRQISIAPSSIRTADYRLIEDRGNGVLVDVTPGPINTYQGAVLGQEQSRVAGSYMNDLLYLSIRLDDGSIWWAEPLADRFKIADESLYAVYPEQAIISPKGFCGTTEFEHGILDEWELAKINDGDSSRGSSVCAAVLACDADYEYYQDYGSTSAVENRINSVINAINTQYESQVGLTHTVNTIIVRTSSSDPYSGNIDNRLDQVRSHWESSQGGINRDAVQLFTGNGGGGGTIGIAWLSAICTSYGYSVVESDCCGSFGCTTDLSAHELGHNWGAGHCDCTGNTMNPYIVCANSFSASTIGSITSYRDSISGCLDGECGDGGGGGSVDNDECADATFISEGNTAFTTIGGTTSSDTYDEAQCSGTYLGEMNDDVWFAWTATASGTITVSTCDLIDFDSDIVIYEGNCGNKTQIGCNGDGDGCDGYSSLATATVSGGNLYIFRIGGWDGSSTGSGSVSLSLEPSGDPVGGCCNGTSCSISTQADCSGTYLGDGSDCSGDPCAPDPTGGCCNGTSCSVSTQADCSGNYLGDGTSCSGNPCDTSGESFLGLAYSIVGANLVDDAEPT
ncbi:MAG: M12 family metallo-peptidase, partial [Phycisphaerales bacterium]|nr:M12 family metallo-peptidase [Phycisphaerales bacterium]